MLPWKRCVDDVDKARRRGLKNVVLRVYDTTTGVVVAKADTMRRKHEVVFFMVDRERRGKIGADLDLFEGDRFVLLYRWRR